jgi:hypothetical protein
MVKNKANRFFLPAASFFLFVLLVVLFHDFLWEYIVNPIVVFFWDVLHILMSIDQIFFYAALVFLFFVLILRLLPHRVLKQHPVEAGDFYAHSRGMGYWQSVFSTAVIEPDQEFLREKLEQLTVAAIITKEKVSETEAVNNLKKNTCGMPEAVHSYFSQPIPPRNSALHKVEAWLYCKAPHLMQPWYRHQILKQEKKMDKIITWLEIYLEMNHDKQT